MKKHIGLMMLAFCGLVNGAQAQDATEKRLLELERQIEVLSKEAEKSRMGDVFTEVGESVFGLGPAASKVYAVEQGLSIGGYGEAVYQNRSGGTSTADFLRAVFYVGYKYNDHWVFNSEIEFEHASTGKEGEASVEFATIDYLHSDNVNFRAGLLLIPMGLINELHEPTTFLSVNRPETERAIIPSTWRENGVGLFGDIGGFSYKAYVVNGLKGENFSDSGLRGGRQKGSKASADDLAAVARLDYTAMPGLLAGGSIYSGNSGQDSGIDISTQIAEGHIDYRTGGLRLRALIAYSEVDDVAELNGLIAADEEIDLSEVDSVGEELLGWYVEAGYDLFVGLDRGEQSLTPFVRFESIDTQSGVPAGFTASGSRDREIITTGLSFQPLDEIVFKADYQFIDASSGDPANQFNLSMGYVF